jgi:hypothetical protein
MLAAFMQSSAHEMAMSACQQGALKKLGLPRSPEYVDQLMAQFGRNGSGKVTHPLPTNSQNGCQELDAAHAVPLTAGVWTAEMVAQVDAEDFYQYVARKEETIWRSFQDLDLDGTGEVDDGELLQALRLGPVLSRRLWYCGVSIRFRCEVPHTGVDTLGQRGGAMSRRSGWLALQHG